MVIGQLIEREYTLFIAWKSDIAAIKAEVWVLAGNCYCYSTMMTSYSIYFPVHSYCGYTSR